MKKLTRKDLESITGGIGGACTASCAGGNTVTCTGTDCVAEDGIGCEADGKVEACPKEGIK